MIANMSIIVLSLLGNFELICKLDNVSDSPRWRIAYRDLPSRVMEGCLKVNEVRDYRDLYSGTKTRIFEEWTSEICQVESGIAQRDLPVLYSHIRMYCDDDGLIGRVNLIETNGSELRLEAYGSRDLCNVARSAAGEGPLTHRSFDIELVLKGGIGRLTTNGNLIADNLRCERAH